MSEDWITVATFEVNSQALLARSVLESAGIACWLANEHLAGTKGFLSHIYGGIQLKVRPVDQSAARAILNAADTELAGQTAE